MRRRPDVLLLVIVMLGGYMAAASRGEVQPGARPGNPVDDSGATVEQDTAALLRGTPLPVSEDRTPSPTALPTRMPADGVASRRTRPAALSDPRYPAPRRSTPVPAPRKRLVASVRTVAPTVEARYGVPWLARSGIASHMGNGYPAGYLALPHGPGWRARICGAGGCVEMTSNDAGPSLAMQREGRVADLSVQTFRAVCGVPETAGLCDISVTILGRAR